MTEPNIEVMPEMSPLISDLPALTRVDPRSPSADTASSGKPPMTVTALPSHLPISLTSLLSADVAVVRIDVQPREKNPPTADIVLDVRPLSHDVNELNPPLIADQAALPKSSTACQLLL